MNMSDWLQLISIIVSSIIAVISIIISVLTLRQTNRITFESNRTYINIYLSAVAMGGDNSVYLVIKNHGNTVGKILDIKCSISDIKKVFILDPFKNLINYELAPRQSFSTYIDTTGLEPFTCTIKYSQGKKIFEESYELNPHFASGMIHIVRQSSSKNEVYDALRNVTEAYIKSQF